MKFLDLTGLQHFYDKYLRPLKDAAFKNVANNLTTTEDGSVLDARQGKALDDKITELNGNKQNLIYIQKFSYTHSVSNASYWHVTIPVPSVSGYTPILVLDAGNAVSANYQFGAHAWIPSGNTVNSALCSNMNEEKITKTIRYDFIALYRKN